MLLDRGADVDKPSREWSINSWSSLGWSPNRNALVAACGLGHENIVRKILLKTSTVDFEGGDNGAALLAACEGGYEDIVEVLLDKDAKVAIQHAYNDAMQAASDGNFENIVGMLLDQAAINGTTTASPSNTMPTGQVSLVKRRRLDGSLFPPAART